MSDIISRDLAVNWHPYTQMKDHAEHPPLVVERAEGIYLFDADGRDYIDAISSWWCNVLGHNHPAITAAISQQAQTLTHVMFAGITHEPAVALSEKLLELSSSHFARVFYSDNGSTAVETAMKASLQYWALIGQPKKTQFVSLDHGYHGDTIGTMSVSGVSTFNDRFASRYTPSFKIPVPDITQKPESLSEQGFIKTCENALAAYLKTHNHDVAAVIVEPLLQAAAGFRIYPAEFLTAIRDITDTYGAHLIVDEVATGFGRTGHLFASDAAHIEADFMCLSKGLTSGSLPFAATLTTAPIYDAFYGDFSENKTFYHGHTYCANPLGCAVSLATLDTIESENVLANVDDLAQHLAARLPEFYAYGTNCRQIGSVIAMEIVPVQSERIGPIIHQAGLAHGIFIRPLGNTLYLMPPLVMTVDQLNTLCDRVLRVLADVKDML